MKPDKDNFEISRLALNAMITFYKNNNNIYRYVDKVPKDAYHAMNKLY